MREMEAKRVLVHTALARANIDIGGAPASALPVLINLVNGTAGQSPYLFLWSADGVVLANGAQPQIRHIGSIFRPDNVRRMASLLPGMDAVTLQQSILQIFSGSYATGREVTYRWVNGEIKTAYVVRILIGDKVYVLGA